MSGEAFVIEASLPAGHVNGGPGHGPPARARWDCWIHGPSRQRDLCLAMILSRVIAPGIEALERSRTLSGSPRSPQSSGLKASMRTISTEAMDWLAGRQARIEDQLAKRHLRDGEMVLYDVSSSYFEGRAMPAGERLGYSRDGQTWAAADHLRPVVRQDGRPVAVEVFTGETHDDKTLPFPGHEDQGPLRALSA